MSEMAPKFCTGCGSALTPEARFCTGCGAAVATTPPAPAPIPAPVAHVAAAVTVPVSPETTATPTPPAAPVAHAEPPVAVIPNARLKRGFMGLKSTTFTLVLTRERIIFAETTSAMLKQSVADARDQAKADGKGFFGQWGAQLGAYGALAESYLSMDPSVALAENPGNFALQESAIDKIKLKGGVVGDQDTNATPDRLIIKMHSGEKHHVDLGSGLRQAKEALVAAEMI